MAKVGYAAISGKPAARASGTKPVSFKNATKVCNRISGMNLNKAKALLERIVAKQEDIDGKYYTNASKAVLALLKSAEANAKFKGINIANLVVHASCHTGFTLHRPRTRRKFAGRLAKISNMQITLK